MKDKLVDTIRAVPISGKTYEEYVEAVARNIFGNLRILGHIDFDGNICIRKDSFEVLEKKYTEEGK